MELELKKQGNDQIVVSNIVSILDDIHARCVVSDRKIAETIGISYATIKTWRRTGIARVNAARKLIDSFPLSESKDVLPQVDELGHFIKLVRGLSNEQLWSYIQVAMSEAHLRALVE